MKFLLSVYFILVLAVQSFTLTTNKWVKNAQNKDESRWIIRKLKNGNQTQWHDLLQHAGRFLVPATGIVIDRYKFLANGCGSIIVNKSDKDPKENMDLYFHIPIQYKLSKNKSSTEIFDEFTITDKHWTPKEDINSAEQRAEDYLKACKKTQEQLRKSLTPEPQSTIQRLFSVFTRK